MDKEDLLQQTDNDTIGEYGKGQIPLGFSEAELIKGRELLLFKDLMQNRINEGVIAKVKNPERAFSVIPEEDRIKPLRLEPIREEFPRYDDISENDSRYRSDIRNLMNFLRGISILAMFIGLISFFFGLSHLFDDLFILCQVIFAHIFIQSPWLAVTFKLPLSGMQLVQFMAWLPIQARREI